MLKDQTVFASPRLALISVDQDVFWFGGLLGDEGPLHTGREAGTASTAQVGRLHLGDDPFRAQGDGLAYGGVAVQLEILVDVGRTLAEAVREQLHFIRMRDEIGHAFLRVRVTNAFLLIP